MKHLDVAEMLVDASRGVKAAADLDAALDVIVNAACGSMEGVDHVGVVLDRPGAPATDATIDDDGVPPGLRAVLDLPVRVDARVVGTLTVYSSSRETVSEETAQLARLAAAHAGLAVGHARRLDNLNAALETRRTIGLALGLLMQRMDLDEEAAFAYLTRLSATSETKLRDVAAAVVDRHAARLRE